MFSTMGMSLSSLTKVAVPSQRRIVLTGIGIYSYNEENSEATLLRERVKEIVLSHPFALQAHGFYADPETKEMRFDVVIAFDTDRAEALATLSKEVSEAFPEYTVHITPDVDVSD